MNRYFKKLKSSDASTSIELPQIVTLPSQVEVQIVTDTVPTQVEIREEQRDVEINLDELPFDPALRKPISDIASDAKERERVRRTYLLRGPCQPKNHDFPYKVFGKKNRKFNSNWFDKYGNWLEYSIMKDAAFCLCCYLFKSEHGGQGGGDAFVTEGFDTWKKSDKFDKHVGECNSTHNKCMRACEDLMKQERHINFAFSPVSNKAKYDYHIRLDASIKVVRFLLRQGLPFRGHDESDESTNKGNFLELLKFLADANDDINDVVLKNAPGNHKMIAPSIQKEIARASAYLTSKAIVDELRDELFSILVDEARDVSDKEQMAVILRYVDKKGCIIECFLGIMHVMDTSSLSLKTAIDELLNEHRLSMTCLRGQGYDGASNMRGEFHGLKSLILEENSSAYYVHCFAHQLQLALVAVAKNHNKVASFFNRIAILINIVGGSCKRKDIFREKQFEMIVEGICCGEITTGRGLNQEQILQRAGDTRWSSHYGTIVSLISMFSPTISVLQIVSEKGTSSDQKSQAVDLLDMMQCFDFAFLLHLMKTILGITNELSLSLQRKDQDLVNAMTLVKVSKERLANMRNGGWKKLLDEVCEFCNKHDIDILTMEDKFIVRGRSRRRAEENTNLFHYQIELFYTVIDYQLQELNNRFTEGTTKLLLCMACLDPSENFAAFDKGKLLQFAMHYPSEYSPPMLMVLDNQLETYLWDVSNNEDFSKLKGIGELAQKMVQTKKSVVYPLVYLMVKLALILPVATASVERAFSAMKIIKTSLRNRIEDEWMNDCLVTYIERNVFDTIKNDDIMKYFQGMKQRKMLL